jgi:hypothetical protein
VDRYSFIVVDLHHLLLAGLPAHFESYHPSQAVRLKRVLLTDRAQPPRIMKMLTSADLLLRQRGRTRQKCGLSALSWS